jgi:hypothetical protein
MPLIVLMVIMVITVIALTAALIGFVQVSQAKRGVGHEADGRRTYAGSTNRRR